MALQKQKFDVSLNGTLDTKTDSKAVIPGNFLELTNAVFTKPGALVKRNGLDQLSQTIDYSDGKIIQGQALSRFQDQLLLFTGSEAYSYLPHNSKWTSKGAVSSIINNSFQVIRNSFTQSNPDRNVLNNVECYAWEDSRGGIRYSIVDKISGNFIVADKLLATTAKQPKVLVMSDHFLILYAIDNVINYSRIYLNALSIDPVLESLTNNYSGKKYDACVSNNVLYLAYSAAKSEAHVISLSNNNVFQLTFGGSNGTDTTKIGVTPHPIDGCLISYVNDLTNTLNLVIATASSASTQTVNQDIELNRIRNIALIHDGLPFTDQYNLKIFFEFEANVNNPTIQYCRVANLQVNSTSNSGLNGVVLKKGIGLYSKPWNHNLKTYITCIHASEFQPTYFLMSDELKVVSKANQNQSGGLRNFQLCEAPNESNGILSIPTLKKGKLESEDKTIFSPLGVVRSSFDFVSPNHFLSASINDNLYVVGGVLQNYDGNKFTEAGFHLYPEAIEINSDKFSSAILAVGTSTAAQISEIVFANSSRIVPGSYFTASGAENAIQYYFWFKVDGIGNDPNIENMIGIPVILQSFFTADEVAEAARLSIASLLEFSTTRINNKLIIANTSNGNSDGVLIGNMNSGNVQPGTYQYVCLWKYVDNAGRIHRSATSLPVTKILNQTGSISITVPLLSPTAKDNVVLEVYRTENLGQQFRRITPLLNPVFNIQNNNPDYTSISFIDIYSDNDLIANELLYNTGFVLDNDSPPPCSLIANYKNRLFIAGLDEKNLIQYTKIIDPGEKSFIAGFSDALYIELNTEGGEITALAGMDDKLIIFKETQIYYISGDGPNNTGIGEFSEPQLISTDVGCSNANSVVLTPNGLLFKSPKGIYILGRGLEVQYIGAPVERYNSLTISSSILLNEQNQVRFLTEDGVALVYDYYVQKWTTFSNYSGTDCENYQGVFHLLRADGKVMKENKIWKDQTDNGYQHIPLSFETANIATAGILGFQRIYRAMMLGEYLGPHKIKMSFAYDYSPIFVDVVVFDAASTLGQNTYGSVSPYGSEPIYGGSFNPYFFRTHLDQQKCTSIRIKVEDIQEYLPSQTENFNEGFSISGLTLEFGIKSGNLKTSFNKTLGSK